MGGSFSNDCDCDEYNYNYRDYDRREYSDRARRERYDDLEADEYAVVPAKSRYEDLPRKAIMSTQDVHEREMSSLKLEEQKIKNKIATERLAFDVQKRQQAKEIHDVKVTLLKKYPAMAISKTEQ
ncbi:uncharacterized protein LOC128983574 isoform X1 [Macrosteles quadrilineatus]|uniref:uncharacterized protein LOC128983574 isoform X1 n=1 Tax=Macrosteles quadrilineatus TaxID=74068 RepID=UPI0023E26528|nr:uncharacterized protein LOC128983574 isoform X1 [Macrosteles quadrilineatus]